jgi:hypothetical protein
MPSPNPEDWNCRFRLIGSQWPANWKLRDRDLEGLEGKAFPLVGATPHPLLRRDPRNAPFGVTGPLGFALTG